MKTYIREKIKLMVIIGPAAFAPIYEKKKKQ